MFRSPFLSITFEQINQRVFNVNFFVRSRYCGGVPGPAYRNSPLSRPGWVIVPIPSTSVGADPEQDVDARAAMASSERGNQGQAAANQWARASRIAKMKRSASGEQADGLASDDCIFVAPSLCDFCNAPEFF